MNESIFWDIIERSLQNSTSQEEQLSFLGAELETLSPARILGFQLRFDKLSRDIYNSTMWCAACFKSASCTDDGFEYFRNWIISRGKTVYNAAKANPDSLVNVDTFLSDSDYSFENFGYVADEVLEKKTGKHMYHYISS